MDKREQDMLKEFSPMFVANGLSGMLVSGEYEAVDVKFTFYRKAPPRETPPKKVESAPQADNTGSPKLPTLEETKHAVFSQYIDKGKCVSTLKIIKDTYEYIICRQLRAGA